MKRYAWIPTAPDEAPLRAIGLAGGRASINQRKLRRHGLAGWQAGTTAALLTAWELGRGPGVFFDVGANAGVYSLLCRLLWPAHQVVAFEPSPAAVAAGRRWARANAVEIDFRQVAVSCSDARGTLYLSSRSDASNSLVPGFREASGTLDVELVRMDSFVEAHDVRPTVVKIDVEQHEPAVIEGAERTLARHRPVVVMERLGTAASRRAHQRLWELGYRAYDLGGRDHLYWPEQLEVDWGTRFAGWLRAVERCTP